MTFDYKHYKPLGVRAVDMVVACIYDHRNRFVPIKTIYLKPQAWEQWVDTMFALNPEEPKRDTYEFDKVNIEKGSTLQPNDISIEYYPLKTTLA